VLVEKGRTLVQLNKGSDNNTVQNSVIRKSRVKENNGSEAHCFAAMASTISNYNKPNFLNVWNLHLVNNEIYDCTDGIQINRIEKDKASAPGDYSGLVIDNNDFYVTPNLYTDGFGNFTPTGDYSCTENAIDIKVGVKSENPSNDEIIRITNNRMWGYKKTDELACPASGSKASVITTHFTDSDYVLVKNNIIFDSENGIWISKPGPGHWSVQNNLFYNVSSPNHVNPWGVLSLDRGGEGRNEAYNNTIIGSVRYLRVGTQAPNGDVRGNVFINAGITGTSAGDPISSTVGYNAYYKSTEYTGNANIGSNIVNSAAGAANNAEYCFTIKRQTAPTQYCIPNAIATKNSPHYIKNTVGGTNNIGVDDLKISTPFYGFDPAALP